MDEKKEILKYCNSIGLDTIGFMRCRRFNELEDYFIERKMKNIENEFEEKDIEKRINPFLYMKDGNTIISIAFPYKYSEISCEENYFSAYTKGKDYHIVVKEYLKSICEFIGKLGGKSVYFVDNNALPERFIASISGIGFIGKNNTLITKKYGSYVFLGEIITDLYIKEDEVEAGKCGNCTACLNACPTKSFNNSNNCLSYITQCKHVEDKWFKMFEGRMFGCDTCQKVCPFNKDAKNSNIEEFRPFNFMNNIDLTEIIYLNNQIFRQKYSLTSCGWRGKNILSRNALINSFGKDKLLNKIDENRFCSPYLIDYYHRLLILNKL